MIEIILGVIVFCLFVAVFFLLKKLQSTEDRFRELSFSKQSQSVRYGKTTEQWIPFSSEFPFDSSDFRFIGSPIDGIAFEDSRIVFCEFKTASSQLSEKQKRIRELVKSKKVEWLELSAK